MRRPKIVKPTPAIACFLREIRAGRMGAALMLADYLNETEHSHGPWVLQQVRTWERMIAIARDPDCTWWRRLVKWERLGGWHQWLLWEILGRFGWKSNGPSRAKLYRLNEKVAEVTDLTAKPRENSHDDCDDDA